VKVTPLQLEVLRQVEAATRPLVADEFAFRDVAIPRDVVDRMVKRGLLGREVWTPGAGPKPVSLSALGRAALAAGDDPTRTVRLAPTGSLSVFTAHPTLEFDA
jgi:hypothetical protein